MSKIISTELKDCVKNNSTCRRQMLMKKFAKEAEKGPVGHSCCDICAKVCRCLCTCGDECTCEELCNSGNLNHQLPMLMPRGVPPYSLGWGVPLGSRKSYHLLDQILQIL